MKKISLDKNLLRLSKEKISDLNNSNISGGLNQKAWSEHAYCENTRNYCLDQKAWSEHAYCENTRNYCLDQKAWSEHAYCENTRNYCLDQKAVDLVGAF